MLDFSTMIRDLGVGPTIIGAVILALLIYSLISGGGKGKGGQGGTGSAPRPGGKSTPPPAPPTAG